MNVFHQLEVVGRGSETQLQMGENLNICFSALRINLEFFFDIDTIQLIF